MADEPRGFWTTLPGILTGLAAVLTAIGGLALALGQSGVLNRGVAVTSAIRPAEPPPAAVADAAPAAAVVDDAPAVATAAPAARPAAPSALRAAPSNTPETNLLAAGSGGHLVAASSDAWKATIDGDETSYDYTRGEAVYAFKDDRAATFDTFGMLITATTGTNVAEYELSAGDTSPTGPFRPIGRFVTQNIKLFGTPYQEVHFTPVTARYLRVKIIRDFGSNNPVAYEFRLR